MPRTPIALLAVCALPLAGLTACSGDEPPDPEEYAVSVAAALEDGSTSLPGWTPDGGWEEELLDGLADVPRTVEVLTVGEVVAGEAGAPDTAEVVLSWSWQLTEEESWDEQRPVTLTLEEDDGAQWVSTPDRSWVAEALAPQDGIEVRGTAAERADILDGAGAPVVTSRPVLVLGLDKTRVGEGATEEDVREAAGEVAEVVGVDAGTLGDQAVAAGPSAFVEALTVREADPGVDLDALEATTAGLAVADELPLAPTRTWAAPVLGRAGPATAEIIEASEGTVEAGDTVGLSGLQRSLDSTLRGEHGVEVVATGGEEEQVLAEVAPRPGEPVTLTLDADQQTLAEDLLAQEDRAAALLVLRPSDGHVLAVASSPGAEGADVATTAAVPPGSTFKVVTALALLRAGLTPESTLECTLTTEVDGYSITNFPDYPQESLGEITLREAISRSCNTALVNARDQISPEDLQQAAASLGIAEAAPSVWEHALGSVPVAEGDTAYAASLFGQGEVLTSPLAVAVMAASVQHGQTVRPVLVTEPESVSDTATEPTEPDVPLTAAEAQDLRELMGAVVSDGGAATVLGDVPGEPVLAKTGSAEVGTGADLSVDSWMVATQGDLAVVAWVRGGGYGSVTAGPIVRDVLLAQP